MHTHTVQVKHLGSVRLCVLEIETFIEQACITLVKSDIKGIYNVTKHLNFK